MFPRGCRRDTLTGGVEATIAVLGATGVYGRHLIPRLVARGYRVRALVRRPEAAAVAAACGAELRVADVFDAASLRAGLEGCDVGSRDESSPRTVSLAERIVDARNA